MSQSPQQQSKNQMHFESQLDEIQQYLDKVVDDGTDQELFISGYLSGHFSLVASQCCLNNMMTLSQLDEQLQLSLRSAFASGELETKDQAQVLAFWQNLLTQVRQVKD